MDEVLSKIENLSQSKRLISCEQVIMGTVHDLHPFLNSSLSETEIQRIQNSLLSLFSANNGEFSIQCSLFIASKILKTMQISKNPQIWDLFNLAISNTTLSTIMAAGYVCKHIGEKFKSQLPRLIDHLFKQKSTLDYPVSYCLRAIFKVGGVTVSQYAHGAIDFCRHVILQNRQTTTVSCIKLLKSIIKKTTNPPISQIIDTVRMMVKEEPIPFIKNEIANLIAQCAFSPLSPQLNMKPTQESEWIIGSSKIVTDAPTELDKSLEILLQFPNYLSMSFPQFLNLLTPSIFSRYHSPLYNFVTNNCPSLLSDIISMLPADARFTYFKQVASTTPMTAQQLQKLSCLCQDDKSILEAAGVALILTYSNDKVERHSALNFFATFSKSHPSIIMSYLRSSLNFLCQTLKNEMNSDRDVISHYSLATVVFMNVQRLEDAIEGENNDLLIQFFNNVFTSPNVTSPHLYGALQLLSVLPARYSEPAPIEAATSVAVKYLTENVDRFTSDCHYRRLLKSLFLYRETHIAANYEQNLLLVKMFLSIQKKKGENLTFPLSAISSLCLIAPVSGASDSEMTEVTRIVVNRALKITPSAELLKSFIARPLPTGFDLLKITTEPSFEKKKEQMILSKIILNFPHLLNSNNQNERKHIIDNLISVKTVNSTAHFILLQLCKSSFILPKSCLPLFLKHLETNNLTVLEIISECVGHFLNTNQTDFKTVFSFIEKKKNVASCLLLSSIFAHTRIPNQSYFSRSLLLLNSLMKNGAILPFAIHSISSMLLTHSMQITNFEIILNQFLLLFQTLNTNYSMQPVVLYLCAECFSLLVETSSSEISAQTSTTNKDEKKLVNTLIVLILRSFQLTPLSYSKEAYFTCCRAIITFAHNLLNEAPISFPSSRGVAASIQLSACAAFSDFLKFETLDKLSNSCTSEGPTFDIDKISQQLLSLLQKTGDQRASSFLISLVNSFLSSEDETSSNESISVSFSESSTSNNNNPLDSEDIFSASNFSFDKENKKEKEKEENKIENEEGDNEENNNDNELPISFPNYNSKLAFWVQIIRRVLLANSLLQNSDIEPSASVKKCCLSICLAVLPHLAEQTYIKTEFLDDIISSASHSTETDRLELQEASFPVLQQVIELFRYKKSEDGGRMLDLYDSQFSQAVTVGFQLNLAVSGRFLSTYLAFITDSLTSDSENCSHVFTVYLNGIKECKQRTSAYYSLATHLCAVSMKYSNVAEMIHDFLVDLLPVFADVFYNAAALWKNKNDWRQMSKFREFASSFYSQLLPSFVWLQTIVGKKNEKSLLISPEVLLSFCIIESSNQKNNNEQWMIEGAFNAIPVLIEYFGSDLPTELLELALKITKTQLQKDRESMNEFIKILLNACKILKNNKEHDSLRLTLLSIVFSTVNMKSFNKVDFVAPALTYIINSDFNSKNLFIHLPAISQLILDNLFDKHRIDEKEGIPLFSLIFHHSPSIVGYVSNLLLKNTNTNLNNNNNTSSKKYIIPSDFTLNVIKIGIPLLSGSFPLRQVSRFCIEMFKKGGMLLIGKALIEKPEIGFALLSQGNAKACFLLCSNDLNNCRAYLRFVQLSLSSSENINNNDCKLSFAKSVFRLAVNVLCKFGSDVQRGHQIVSLCVQLIQNVKQIVGVDELNKMFNVLDLPEKLATFKMMNLHISKAELKKRNKNLAAFSTIQRTRRGGSGAGGEFGDDDSEWQTLDTGDGSDSF